MRENVQNISFSDGQQTNKQTRLVVTSKVLHVLALEEGLSLLKKLLQAIRKIKPPVFCYVIYSPLCYNMSDGRKLTLYSFEILPTGADLPKAFTSRRLSASPPLSIWTMTYLPDASWPGISAMIISQFESDLR